MLPRQDVELAVWRVCCLAALSAMNHGRRLMGARQLSGDAAGPDVVEVAVRSSTATFWQHMKAAGQPHPIQLRRFWAVAPSSRLIVMILNGQLMCFGFRLVCDIKFWSPCQYLS